MASTSNATSSARQGAALVAPVSSQHQANMQKLAALQKAKKEYEQGRAGASLCWKFCTPVAVFDDNGEAVDVRLQTLCDKSLSVANPHKAGKGHLTCLKCQVEWCKRRCPDNEGDAADRDQQDSTQPPSKRARIASAALTTAAGASTSTGGSGGAGAGVPLAGGASDLQLVAELTHAKPLKQQQLPRVAKGMQEMINLEWCEASIVSGDSNRSAASDAKRHVFAMLGVHLASRETMRTTLLDDVFNKRVLQRDGLLANVNSFAVAFDAGKDKDFAGGNKLVTANALLPTGDVVFLGTIDTHNLPLDSPAYVDLLVTNFIDKFGGDGGRKISGLMCDAEAVCRAACTRISDKYPHMAMLLCHAHGLHHVVEDLLIVPAIEQVINGCHEIIKAIKGHKDLKVQFDDLCAASNISSRLALAPSHRFAYHVEEMACVSATYPALVALASDPVVLQKFDHFADSAALISGVTHVGEGNNMFTFKAALDKILPALKVVQQAISVLEADHAQLGNAAAAWFHLENNLAKLAPALQGSMRGRGSAAAARRECVIRGIVQARREQYCTPAADLAFILDPINSVEETGSVRCKPNVAALGPERVQEAKKEAKRLARGYVTLYRQELGTADTPATYEEAAGEAFDDIITNGFPVAVTEGCRVYEDGEFKRWAVARARRCLLVAKLKSDDLTLVNGHRQLSAVCDRVLSQHATVCSVDRVWSQYNIMVPPTRSQLQLERANKMMLIKMMHQLRMRREGKQVDAIDHAAFWRDVFADD